MNPTFSLAPLQGITDFAFRNLYNKHFKGVDKFYSPFIRLQNDGTIKKSQIIDILPDNNSEIHFIPQIICNNSLDFIFLSNFLSGYGYQEINWNLGCPYPMVAKRQLGSGLIPFPERIRDILEEALPKIKCQVSIKIRSGYEAEDEILKLLPLLAQFPITELIIHPRIAKQMYKGHANPLIVEQCIKIYNKKVAYNGDIRDIKSFLKLKEQFGTINHWMIGRALISNPFLIEDIILERPLEHKLKLERFSAFHEDLFDFYCNTLSGHGHILTKMLHLWEYFADSFSNSHKVYKKIKKASSIQQYNAEIHDIFNNEIFGAEN